MPAPSSRIAVDIRPCAGIDSWRRCVELQSAVWGFDAAELVPIHVLAVAAKTGGQLLGAFDQTGEQIGFLLAFPAFRSDRRYLHSHMLAVLPEYQNRGVGRVLKLVQRADAIVRGIDLIEWTFDPLEFRNAYFNIVRLGAVVRRYVPDLYGPSSSPLHRGLPTDRLIAEWSLKSERVQAAIRDQARTRTPDAVRIKVQKFQAAVETVADAQRQLRSDLTGWLERGFAVTGFEWHDDLATYVLEPYEN